MCIGNSQNEFQLCIRRQRRNESRQRSRDTGFGHQAEARQTQTREGMARSAKQIQTRHSSQTNHPGAQSGERGDIKGPAQLQKQKQRIQRQRVQSR